jgi:YVTN family beta-propeller protein
MIRRSLGITPSAVHRMAPTRLREPARGLLSGGQVARTVAVAALALSACLLAGCTSGSAAATPTTPTAYVAIGAGVANPGTTVAVVNTVTSKPQTPVTSGTLPAALAVTADGKHVLIANRGEDSLIEVDVASGKVTKRVGVGLEPDAVAVTPNGALALVANFGDNTVTPVSLPSLHAGRPIAVGRQPVALAVSPKGDLALVSNYQDGSVSPIVLSNLVAGSPVPAGAEPDALYISHDGTTALVADFQTSVVTPISLLTMAPAPVIPVGGNATGIAGLPSSVNAYVSGGTSVTPIDMSTHQPGAPIGIGTTAEALAMDPKGGTAWVCGGDGTLVHVNLAGRTVIGRVEVGGQPSAVVIATGRRSVGGFHPRPVGPRRQTADGRSARLVASGLGGLQDHEGHGAAQTEPHRFVEADGVDVVRRCVQERNLVATHNGLRHRFDQGPSQPLSTMGRVGGHGADLAEAGEPNPLAGHGNETAPTTNPQVSPELHCAGQKRPGAGLRHEGQHVDDIVGAKRDKRVSPSIDPR